MYKLNLDDSGWMGDLSRGASMGRWNTIPESPTAAPMLHLTRMRMVDGDYDTGGAYWGAGDAQIGWMYCAESDDPEAPDYTRIFLRATQRDHAKREIWRLLPYARIHQSPAEKQAERDEAWDVGYEDAMASLGRQSFVIHPKQYDSGYLCGIEDLKGMGEAHAE